MTYQNTNTNTKSMLNIFTIFTLIFCIVIISSGTMIWFFNRSIQDRTSPTAVSPLLFGRNLTLDTDQVQNLDSIKAWLELLHIRIVRLTVQHNASFSTLQQVVFLLKELHITPMVVLHTRPDPTAKLNDLTVINLMTSHFAHEPVYYEYGDEEDSRGMSASDYTNSWNTTVAKFAQIAPNARFIGPTTHHYDSDYLNTFLTHARLQPFAVSWHEFTCDASSDEEQCLSHIPQWTDHVADARKLMQKTIGGILPITITEWNYAANMTANDGKSNNTKFMTKLTNQAFQTLVDNNIFASTQYSYGENITSLTQNFQPNTGQYTAFQMFSEKYQALPIPKSIATIPVTIPSTSSGGIFVDNLDDWTNTFMHTQYISFDKKNCQAFNKDTSRAHRGGIFNTHEEIVWKKPQGTTSFTAVTFFLAYEPVSPFSTYLSADGTIWQLAIPEILLDPLGNWYQYLYTLPDLSHANYVKLRWNNIQGHSWSPQVGKVIFTREGFYSL